MSHASFSLIGQLHTVEAGLDDVTYIVAPDWSIGAGGHLDSVMSS